jgi:hypothetical protein
MRIQSLIKLLIFAALISALSCATTPKVTDIAELHYGDNEADIVERFGRGSSVLFFDISGLVYHLRSYSTALTEDDYALLFANGRLVSVSEEIPLYEDCMLLNEIIDWEECLSDLILKMRGDAFDMDTHDFSEGFDRQKQQEDKLAGAAVLVTVVAVPSVVMLWPVGVACAGMEAAYNNGVIDCREIMHKITTRSYDVMTNNVDDSAIELIDDYQSLYIVSRVDKRIGDRRILKQRWGCRSQGFDKSDDVKTSIGMKSGRIVWASLDSNW